MFEKILFSSVILKIISASHFFGGSIVWKPLNQNLTGDIDIIFQFRFYWDFDTYSCSDSDILGGKIIGARESNIRIGNILQVNPGVICTDNGLHDGEYIWSGGQQAEIITLNQSIGLIEANFASCCWINLVYGGNGWNLKLKFDFKKRTDNNETNSSPIALMSPLTFLPLNYTSVIKVPTRDPDFDVVKCRWALSNLSECGGVCNSAPGALIDQENCTITFTPEKEGFYVMALQIEDFYNATDDTPLSSIPLQFMLFVENRTIETDLDPIEFYHITPEDGSEFILEYNETLFGQIVVNSSSRIVDLMTLSPIGLWKSPIAVYNDTTDLWYVNFTWTHLQTGQEGLNLFCFRAQNLVGASTELRCINLIGGITPHVFTRPTSSPSFTTSLGTVSSTIKEDEKPLDEDEKPLDEDGKPLGEDGKKNANNDWIIPVSVSLGILVLLAIVGLVSFILLKKCLRKNKIENDFLQPDLDGMLNRDNCQMTDSESMFNPSRPTTSSDSMLSKVNCQMTDSESMFDASRPATSSTMDSSEIDQNEHKNIIKKKETPKKRYCVICGKTHVTGFYHAKKNSSSVFIHKFPAYNINPKNEVYLRKKKTYVNKNKMNKVQSIEMK